MPTLAYDNPPVYVDAVQYDRLFELAAAGGGMARALLRRELDRAIVLDADEPPYAFVRLGATARYRDIDSGRCSAVTLVEPEAADLARGRLSVLAPVGAALVGLTPGACFRWQDEAGRDRALEVLEVQP